jgi:effector-binding domain-containing protein
METAVKYEVKEITWPGKTFVTKRATLPFNKLSEFFSRSYGEIYKVLNKSQLVPEEMPCAIYYSVDPVRGETDFAAAVPVQGTLYGLTGMEQVNIPRARALMINYVGSYENMHEAYDSLEKYLHAHQLSKEWTLEEYLSDPAVEKDPSHWKTNIYFILK